MHPVAQRLSLDERHGEPEPALGGAGIKDAEDVGVLEAGCKTDFAFEALAPDIGGDLVMQDLQGYRAVVPEIMCEVDNGETSAAKLSLDAIPVDKSILEARLFHVLDEVRVGADKLAPIENSIGVEYIARSLAARGQAGGGSSALPARLILVPRRGCSTSVARSSRLINRVRQRYD